MVRLVSITSRLLLFFAVMGVATQSHPLTGLLHHALRWPIIALCFLLGGFSLARRANAPVFYCLVCMSVLFGDWIHAYFTRATPDEREHRPPITLLTYNLGGEAADPSMTLEAIHGHPADLLFFQEVSPSWRARLESEAVLKPLHRAWGGRARSIVV